MESKDTASDSAPDFSDEETIYTPSATDTHDSDADSSAATETDFLRSSSPILFGSAPHAGATFLIRDRKTGLVIALKNGDLGLHPDEKDHGDVYGMRPRTQQHGRGSHWECVENDELWLGFKSSVSGQFIGHNGDKGNWRFIAEKKHHKWWECFCVREDLGGGHVLLVKHDHGFRAMRAGGEGGRELVVAGKGEGGTAWEFIVIG
ncbi:hypothetical protein BJY00DRAFT_313782 [Aspergillus carlsbadensis]|nr:hypothetical protein BJY00DRAFT_313782 [Aspergillus carlsbadensis]